MPDETSRWKDTFNKKDMQLLRSTGYDMMEQFSNASIKALGDDAPLGPITLFPRDLQNNGFFAIQPQGQEKYDDREVVGYTNFESAKIIKKFVRERKVKLQESKTLSRKFRKDQNWKLLDIVSNLNSVAYFDAYNFGDEIRITGIAIHVNRKDFYAIM